MDTVYILNIHTPYSLPYTSFQKLSVNVCKIAWRVANSADPDQTSATSDLGLLCFLRPVCPKTKSNYGNEIQSNPSDIILDPLQCFIEMSRTTHGIIPLNYVGPTVFYADHQVKYQLICFLVGKQAETCDVCYDTDMAVLFTES